MNQDQLLIEERHRQEETVKSFIRKLSDNSDIELSGIITWYISYLPETVKAALIVSVDKGLITYELRELLWNQIEANFEAHNKNIKQYKWESNNAFVKYISGYQDDEIYNIIEDPHEIVMDVYHAVLVTAKERELISDQDFVTYYENAKSGARTEDEIRNAEIDEFLRTDDPANEFESESELEAEKEKFWKCPKCNQLVGMEFSVCWNCQTNIPDIVEHPDREEIIKEVADRGKANPVKAGFYLIGGGIFVILLDQLCTYTHIPFFFTHIGGFVLGGFMVLSGIVVIVYSFFLRREPEEPPVS